MVAHTTVLRSHPSGLRVPPLFVEVFQNGVNAVTDRSPRPRTVGSTAKCRLIRWDEESGKQTMNYYKGVTPFFKLYPSPPRKVEGPLSSRFSVEGNRGVPLPTTTSTTQWTAPPAVSGRREFGECEWVLRGAGRGRRGPGRVSSRASVGIRVPGPTTVDGPIHDQSPSLDRCRRSENSFHDLNLCTESSFRDFIQ